MPPACGVARPAPPDLAGKRHRPSGRSRLARESARRSRTGTGLFLSRGSAGLQIDGIDDAVRILVNCGEKIVAGNRFLEAGEGVDLRRPARVRCDLVEIPPPRPFP